MIRYSDELIDEIKNNNDIVDVVSQYVHLKEVEEIILDYVHFITRNHLLLQFLQISKYFIALDVE